VSLDKVQRSGVRTEKVEKRIVSRPVRGVGTIQHDESRLWIVTVRSDGYVEDLFVNKTGQHVRAGEPLFRFYSPQIQVAQADLMVALRAHRRGAGASDNLEGAMRLQLDELGDAGAFELFAAMRRLGHRLGLSSWAGPEAASPAYLDRLVPLFDRLDSGDSFVRPAQAVVTYVTRKRRERAAMQGIESIVSGILAARARRGTRVGDYLDRIYDSYADLPTPERAIHTARDIMIIHMGAQSNLYAALGWTLVNLLLHPAYLDQVAAGDDGLLEQCANESIRMAQRSITLRQTLTTTQVTDGARTFALAPGVMLTTMLSVTNTSAAPELRVFDPAHYEGRKLSERISLPARELVSTFGHGRHACPAQRFSISAIRIAVRRLVDRYHLEPRFRTVVPRRQQIGGVARAAHPCVVGYRRRS